MLVGSGKFCHWTLKGKYLLFNPVSLISEVKSNIRITDKSQRFGDKTIWSILTQSESGTADEVSIKILLATMKKKIIPQEPQKLSSRNHIKFRNLHRYRGFHSCNHRKWLSYQILCGKTVKNVQIHPQIMSKKLKVWEWVSLMPILLQKSRASI